MVNNRPNAKNFTHADLLQKWTRATNVRLRLMRTKNLLGHLMAVAKQDPSVTRRVHFKIFFYFQNFIKPFLKFMLIEKLKFF